MSHQALILLSPEDSPFRAGDEWRGLLAVW